MSNLAFTNGSVSTFKGATGLLQTFASWLSGTEVTGETLAGGPTTYSGTLANQPVGLGRIIVDYDFAAVGYQATDDGAGNITGTNITAGSITYSTGAYSITFSGAPDAAPTCDYLYGQPGQDWRLLLDQAAMNSDGAPTEARPGDGLKEYIFQNTGNSGQEDIIIGIREYQYVTEGNYGWNLNGYTFYNTGQYWRTSTHNRCQPDSGTYYDYTREMWINIPNICLNDDTMYYWFFSNRQRIIAAVKVSSNYWTMYMGFGRRFGSPGEYPIPLIVKGSSASTAKHNDANNTYQHYICTHNYWDGSKSNFLNVQPDGTWMNNDTYNPYSHNVGTYLMPRDLFYTNYIGTVLSTSLNRHLFTPVWLRGYYSEDTYMDMDGVYHVTGTTVQSEDVIYYGGKKHIIFQNIWRTNYYDFCAIEWEDGTTTSTTSTTTTTTTSTTTTSTTTTSTTTTTTTT